MKILDKRVKPQDFLRTWWVATVEAGVSREDVLKTDFWSYVSLDFKPYDRVEIRTDDSEWFGEYLIMECDKTFAKLKELNYWHLGSKGRVSNKLDFEYFWGGPHGLHGIRRTTDGETMVNKLATQKEALEWLTVHLESISNGNIPT